MTKPPLIKSQHGRVRLPFAMILSTALAAGIGFWLAQHYFSTPAETGSASAQTLETVLRYPLPVAIEPFTLRTADDQPLTSDSLRGRWTVVFFGFTHCPDICPTTLARLAEAAKQWQPLGEDRQPRVLFVSVDPGRDSGQRTNEYAAYFNPDFVGATADDDTLRSLSRSLGMVYMKADDENSPDGYTMDHSASLVLIDPQLRRAGLIRSPLDPAAIGRDLTLLASQAATDDAGPTP